MKRGRSASPGRKLADVDTKESGSFDQTTSKYQRIEQEEEQVNEDEIIWCSLAPNCSKQPTPCYNIEELESHYVRFHAFICRADGCSCVFEREHYLNLHQTEFHDPLAQMRKERGESIYQCLLLECRQFFPSPHQRKRHLISEHHFEDTFFFGVTKYGIGDQIRAWGSGEQRSLTPNKDASNKKRKEPTKGKMDLATEGGAGDTQIQAPIQTPKQNSKKQNHRSVEEKSSDNMIEDVSSSMNKLSVVPQTIRFGRGGSKVGFERQSHKKRNASLSNLTLITNLNTDTEQEQERKDEMMGVDDSAPDESPERDPGSLGVRFSEDVAIRFLSPVDHRYNEGRRGKKRYGGGGGGGGRRGGRTGGVHSDDESGSRNKNANDRIQASRGRSRGRGRGGGGGGSERPSSSQGAGS